MSSTLVKSLGITVLFGFVTTPCCFSQTGSRELQREDYSKIFAAESAEGRSSQQLVAANQPTVSPESGGSTGSGLRPDQKADYGKVYRALIDAQESRTAVPSDARNLVQYVTQSRASMTINGVDLTSSAPPGVVYLLLWNHVALDATALDHSTLSGSFGEQFGPARTSRALAIVHLAMFEAVNAIKRNRPTYMGLQQTILSKVGIPEGQITPATASIDRAIVEAGYQTLLKLYPEKKSGLLDTAYTTDLVKLGDVPDAQGNRPANMILAETVGLEAAKAILAKRDLDGSELPDLSSDDFASSNPKTWHQDPITQLPPALGGNWARVKPFLIPSADAFRPGKGPLAAVLPPAFNSPEFIQAYKEVKDLGGDPNAPISAVRWPTQTSRTGAADPSNPVPADNTNQTFVGIFWGYDGTALLCAPPRLYNMIATSVALKEAPITTIEDMSQYLALLNLAMADAGIAAWDAKYHFLIPRPITYIRNVDADNTPEGSHNRHWTPLGAPVTNGTNAGRNLTPPFPAYPSGHATFGGAVFDAMTRYFKKLDPSFPNGGVPFDFVSDEFNGVNRGPGEAAPRQKVVAHFQSFQEAEKLNAQSRIYLGIHWQFDADHGILQGHAVAEDVFERFVNPTP